MREKRTAPTKARAERRKSIVPELREFWEGIQGTHREGEWALLIPFALLALVPLIQMAVG